MTAAGRYRYLFKPLQVGPVTVPNRIVFSAHLTNYAQSGLPSDQHVAYYEARARGGAGLIITEEHSVHPTDWPYEKMIHAFRPEVVKGYRRITDAVHRYGTPILAQINHNGGQASSMYSRRPVWAPSPLPDPMFREVPKAVNHHEIAEIVHSYATVAARCIEGGFDGIELQCSHSSIVRGFLSPATNIRTDEYGGSLQNRSRLLRELVTAVRAAIGKDVALGVRLCGDELIEGGTTIDEAVAVAVELEREGSIDYVNTSIGVATASLFAVEASMHVPPGYALFVPSALRDAVSLPVVGVGRFKDPLQADRAIAAGHCDLVGVVRGQIADADFAAKARAGASEQIRLCLSCNQECVGRMGLNRWLGCIENPATGREAERAAPADGLIKRRARAARSLRPYRSYERATHTDDLVKRRARATKSLQPYRNRERATHTDDLAERRTSHTSYIGRPKAKRDSRDVLVVGAGPAGLQAAITAARCGHRVTVLERDDSAGGQVRLAASVPSRAELGDVIRNQLAECRRYDVSIAYGQEVHADAVAAREPDVVVVATGSTPVRPSWAPAPDDSDRIDGLMVCDVSDVLRGDAQPQGSVLVVDLLGFHQATSVAELLADRGASVEIVSNAMVVGQDLGITLDLETWWMRAEAKQIVQSTDRIVMAADSSGVRLLHHPTSIEETRHPDWVVNCAPNRACDSLYFKLREMSAEFKLGVEVHRVGDALAPRRIHSAVIDGDRVGAAL